MGVLRHSAVERSKVLLAPTAATYYSGLTSTGSPRLLMWSEPVVIFVWLVAMSPGCVCDR